MNFDSLTNKLKDSASKAATAARSFKGFDEMAAKDEYIHSESLNVKRKDKKSRDQSLELVSATKQHAQDDNTDMSFSSQHSNASLRVVNSHHHSTSPSSPPLKHRPPVPLLSVVQAALSHSSHSKKLPSRIENPSDEEEESSLYKSHFLEMEDDEGDGETDDDDEHDPILSRIRQETTDHSRSSNDSHKRRTKSKQKKNANRFMDDLENRISIPESSHNSDFEEDVPLMAAATSNEQAGTMGWMSWALQPKQTAPQQQQSQAPWSRPKKRGEKQQEAEEDFQVVKSSGAVLNQDEMQELAQLKQQQQQQNHRSMLGMWNFLIQEHPRESFIVFTLLLAAFAYFHSRRETVEDDVT
jgi:hypothetical protein